MDQSIRAIPREIKLGRKIESITVLVVDGEEGLPLNQAAKLYGIEQSTVHYHLTARKISYTNFSRRQIQELKEIGLLSSRTARLRFLNRNSLLALSQVVNSDRAKKIHASLWNPESAKAGLVSGELSGDIDSACSRSSEAKTSLNSLN